jgi:hypothetical protein
MELVHEFRNDTKVASASSDCPEEIRILRGACGLDRTIGSDYCNLHQIIDGQAIRTTVMNILGHLKYEIFAEDKERTSANHNLRQALV